MTLAHDLTAWLWRLLPGNPILLRVVAAAGKRPRHLLARLIYLAALVVVVLFGGGFLLGTQGQSLADLAKQATRTFMAVSVGQLLLMCFIAPVFCAGAITQEKDANTYHILLTTPLSNAQIVLGTLFSRIFFVWVLLLAGLPIFCITMIYGGVTTTEIFESFGLAAATGLLTGSVAIMISFLKVGTRRTIFSFFIGIAVYLLGVGMLGLSTWGQLGQAPPAITFLSPTTQFRMSWLASGHPFLALLVVTGQTPAPDPAAVQHFGRLGGWALASPQYAYMTLAGLASAGMVLISLFNVRRGAKEGQPTLLSRLVPRFAAGQRRRKPRRVWRNPIAWREAVTRASAAGRSLVRVLFIAAGLALGLVLLILHHGGSLGPAPAAVIVARAWLVPLVWIELTVVLLVVTSTAATTLTREKEAQTMEILLSTPLTSRYIVAGMLQGLVRLVIPLIAAPTLTVAAFVLLDALRPAQPPVTTPEALLLVPLLLTSYAALAAMVGLHFSLTSRRTVPAVMISTAIVLGAAGLLSACGYATRGTDTTVAGVLLPFTPIFSLKALLDPWSTTAAAARGWVAGGGPSAPEINAFRVVRAIFSLVAAGAYLGLTYGLYRNMVRGFDMIVRRQSA